MEEIKVGKVGYVPYIGHFTPYIQNTKTNTSNTVIQTKEFTCWVFLGFLRFFFLFFFFFFPFIFKLFFKFCVHFVIFLLLLFSFSLLYTLVDSYSRLSNSGAQNAV